MSITLDCDSIAKLRLKNIKFRYSRLQITCCDNDLSALYSTCIRSTLVRSPLPLLLECRPLDRRRSSLQFRQNCCLSPVYEDRGCYL